MVGHWEVKHGTVDVQKDGKTVKVCKIYRTITCDEHHKFGEDLFTTFFKGRFATPNHVWLGPDAKELFRSKTGTMGPAEFQKDVEKAVGMVPGAKATKTEYDQALASLAEGQGLEEKGQVKKAQDSYTKVAKSKNERLRPLGEEKLKALDAKGAALVEEAKAKFESAPAEARAALKRIAEDYKPLECSKLAAEALKALDKGK